MRQSRRASRMERHYTRGKKVPGFNLVSLMDIFTILVFFLLVNSSEVQKLPTTKVVSLPESTADVTPNESIVVMVTPEDILVENEVVAKVENFKDETTSAAAITALQSALIAQMDKQLVLVVDEDGKKRPPEVAVMADKSIPYNLLHKVMQAATAAGVEKVSLAVIQKVPEEG